MKTTSYRTSFSLDEATARRLHRLASIWRVSRAEVVRRAVALADARTRRNPNPGEVLRKLHARGGGLVRETAVAYLAELDTARATWRSRG